MYIKLFGTPLLVLFFVSATLFSFGQESIRFKTDVATPEQEAVYKQYFKAYTLATLAADKVAEKLSSQSHFDHLIVSFGNTEFVVYLQAHDLRSADYTLRAATDEGIIEYPRSPNMSYMGHLLDGGYEVRITSSERTFYGLFEQAHDAIYIEPAKHLVPSAGDNQYVIYKESDNLKKFPLSMCGTKDKPTPFLNPEEMAEPADAFGSRTCKVVQIALADDHFMFNDYGSVQACEDHNMAVINNVLTNYDNDFSTDLQFDVVEIFVATSDPTDPWTNSTNIDLVLDDFTDWGPTGFSHTHDVASLWSGRNFNGDVIGLAWLSAVCTNFKYNVLEDFTGNANLLRVLQAHEMGHNFSANHDANGSNTIMAPVVNNTNTWSAASITSINNYINGASCLGPCGTPQPPVADFDASPTEGCATLTVFFDDQSLNNPTSWSWSFPGGNPSTSSNANPIVNYNNPGTYNVSLTVSNAQGSNSVTMNNFITVHDDPVADFDYQVDELTVDFDNFSINGDSYLWTFGDGETSNLFNPIHVYDEDGTYHVVLTVFNDCGSDTYSVNIEITTLPFADFSSDVTNGCVPFEVEFFNFSSQNAETFLWTFPGGSPATSTAFEPVVLYETPGTYNVTLTAFNAAGQDTYTAFSYITVMAQPSAVFTSTANGLQVTFSSAGSVGNSYSWNFGDGGTSTLQNPVHNYAAGGAYTVTLNVSNGCGTSTIQHTVNVVGSPEASFVSNISNGCAPLVVQFTSTSLGNPTSYSWFFEGGNPLTSTIANPVVTYNNPGSFDVSLTVTNAAGSDTETLSDFVTVLSPPFSDFVVNLSGAQAFFSNQSANSTSYQWNFGDGESSTEQNPVHVYAADGTYTAMLIATGVCGTDTSTIQVLIQTPAQAGFSFNQSSNCSPVTVSFTNESSPNATSFNWSFPGGNPSSSTLANPMVTYNNAGLYNVTLIATAPAGADTLSWPQLISVGTVPNAAFLISTNGMNVTFTNQSDNADTYLWLFGDGQTSTDESPEHPYAAYGNYEVQLISTNECGSDTMIVFIELSTVPNSGFIYSAHNGCAPFTVQFHDQSQNNPTSWLWTFEGGNPATSSEQNPLVSYEVPGDYFVSLRVENSEGSDVLVLDDLIQVSGAPDATFNHNQLENVVFLEYPGIDYDSLRWSFGDSRTDNSLNPTVEYHVSGTYEIELIVYNPCGTDTATVLVTINITATQDPEQLEGNWQIRPNPVTDVMMLYGQPADAGEMTVTIRDVSGRAVNSDQFSFGSGEASKEFFMGALPPGLYLVELRDKNARQIVKVIHL